MPDDANTRNFVVRRSETDPMAHVNNAGYVDYLDEQYLAMYEAPIEAPLPFHAGTAPSSSARPRPARV